jgi:hypothetical protein
MKTILTLILTCLLTSIQAQNKVSRFDLNKVYKGEYPALNAILPQISDAQVMDYGVRWETDLTAEVDVSRGYKFLKTNNDLLAFETYHALLLSDPFKASLRDDFKLNTSEKARLFQDMLSLADGRFWDGFFFREGDHWYFIRKVFFDEIEAWKVTVDNHGSILSIDYNSEMEVVIPEDFGEKEMSEVGAYLADPNISQVDEVKIQKLIEDKLTFSREIDEIPASAIAPVSSAQIFILKYALSEVIIDEEYGEYNSTSTYEYPVLVLDQEVHFFYDRNQLVTSELFKESIKSSFFLSEDRQALLFEAFLDQLTAFEPGEKASFNQYNSWFFVREERFGNPAGFRVETDEKGSPVSIYYSDNLGVAPPEEVFDESAIDWGFALIDPMNAALEITEGMAVPFGVAFNDVAASKMGAWIMVGYQGEMSGMYAGTEMQSPYYGEVTGEIMTVGKHIIDFYLMRPGMDTETALDKISLDITVLPFDDSGITWFMAMDEPKQDCLTIAAGESIPVILSFNAEDANRLGVNLIIRFNGNDVGGSHAPHLSSPFETQIPGDAMTTGKHKVEFLLMTPGGSGQKVLSSVELNMDVN